jgi:uncharacterized protein GlcG (DUF336 family)
MQLTHELVMRIVQRGIDIGLKRGFFLAIAVVDPSGRARGVVRHDDALWVTPQLAEGKARLASAYKNSTGVTFARLQKDRPLYGASVAALNAENDWFLAEGGMAIVDKQDGKEICHGAIGVSGSFPATVDQEIADELVAWVKAGAK